MSDELKILHVAMAADSNYLEFVAICMASLITNNRTFEKVKLHLLINNVKDDELDKFKKTTDKWKNLEIKYIDISNLSFKLGIKVPDTIALTAYARLFLASLIDQEVEKILYIDCDTIIVDDLEEINSLIITESIGGILDVLPDLKAKENIGIFVSSPYVNSGVLLINLKKWRKLSIQNKFLEYLLIHEGKVHHHDQGIINAICNGDKRILHPRYNLHSSYFSHPFKLIAKTNFPHYTEKEIKEALTKPAIIHFTTGYYNRPWMKNCKHPLKSEFLKYKNMTEWADKPLQNDNRSFIVKLISWEFLNLPLWCYFSSLKLVSLFKSILGK